MISSLSLGAFSSPAALPATPPNGAASAGAAESGRHHHRPRTLSGAGAADLAGRQDANGAPTLPRGSLLDILG